VGLVKLEEAAVRVGLDPSKDRDWERIATLREIPNRLGRHQRDPCKGENTRPEKSGLVGGFRV